MKRSKPGKSDHLALPSVLAALTLFFSLFLAGLCLFSFPEPYAARFIKHNPNYSLFYLLFMPLIVAITAYSMRELKVLATMPAWFKGLCVFPFLLVPFITMLDARNKGTPIPISHLKFQDGESFEKAMKAEESIRRLALSPDTSVKIPAASAQARYEMEVAEILGVEPEAVRAFASVSDFLRRGTWSAYIDYVMSTFGAAIAMILFLVLMHILFSRRDLSERQKNYFLMLFWLWTIWFPTRAYSFWYQNFYSMGSFGFALGLAGLLAVCGLLLTILIQKKKPVNGALTVAFGVISAVTPILAKINPDYVAVFGEWIDALPMLIFLTGEFIILATLVVFVWVYFTQHAGMNEESLATESTQT